MPVMDDVVVKSKRPKDYQSTKLTSNLLDLNEDEIEVSEIW